MPKRLAITALSGRRFGFAVLSPVRELYAPHSQTGPPQRIDSPYPPPTDRAPLIRAATRITRLSARSLAIAALSPKLDASAPHARPPSMAPMIHSATAWPCRPIPSKPRDPIETLYTRESDPPPYPAESPCESPTDSRAPRPKKSACPLKKISAHDRPPPRMPRFPYDAGLSASALILLDFLGG